MTAKTKHGFKGHHTRGADPGTPHERLTRAHKRPGRAEGAALGLMAHGPAPISEAAPSSPYMMGGPETAGEQVGGMPGGGGDAPPGVESGMGPSAEPTPDGDDMGD